MKNASQKMAEVAELQDRFIQDNLRRVFVMMYSIVGNIAEAQAMTQEAFIGALKRSEHLNNPERTARWLSRINTNTVFYLRCRVGGVDCTPGLSAEKTLADSYPSQCLRGGLSHLSVKERIALILREVEHAPPEEVASQMQCSMATFRSHMANARIKFRRYLERRTA